MRVVLGGERGRGRKFLDELFISASVNAITILLPHRPVHFRSMRLHAACLLLMAHESLNDEKDHPLKPLTATSSGLYPKWASKHVRTFFSAL
jgi:hypothetical protein